MKIRFLNGRLQGRIYELKKGAFTIGRGSDCDLVLDDEGISRAHCRFFGEGGEQFFLEDMGSTNGVRLNGQRIDARALVKSGDNIGIGQHVVQVTASGEVVDSAVLPVSDSKPGMSAAPAAAARAYVPPARPLPWVRILIVLVLLGVLGFVVFLTFFAPTAPGNSPASGGTVATTPALPQSDTTTAPASTPSPTSPASTDDTTGSADGTAASLAATKTPMVIEGSTDSGAATTPVPVKAAPAAAAAGISPEPTPAGAVNGATAAVVESEPSGAEIKMNGAVVGKTPCVLRNLPVGRQTLVLSLKGYEDFVRQIHVPDTMPDKPFVMKQKPGTLLVLSNPPGATVLQGSRVLGQTPLLADDLGPAEYELLVSQFGFDSRKVKAVVSAVRPEKVTADLKSKLGNVEVSTLPAGCLVYLNDTLIGKTLAAADPVADSRPLAITNLLEGEHTVRAKHPCGVDIRARVQIVRGESKPVVLRLWVVDTEVTMKDGSKKQGMLMERNAAGDIVLKESARKMERYFKPQIEKVTTLSLDQTREIMAKVRPLDAKTEASAGGGEPAAAPAKATGVDTGADADDAPPADTVKAVAVEAMESDLASGATAKYRSRALVIQGVPLLYGRDAQGSFYVTLGAKTRCEFTHAFTDDIKDRLRRARDDKKTVRIRGTFGEYDAANGALLKDCALVE